MPTASRRKRAPGSRSNGFPLNWTLEDLRHHVGGVPLNRIRLFPTPGTATEKDAIRFSERDDRLYELVDGILVEKAVGMYESVLTCFLIQQINNYFDKNDIGFIAGADGPFRLFAGRMRLPDISVVLWEHFPNRRLPAEAVLSRGPDLPIEFISKGNTRAEMRKKLQEYFRAGAKLVWYIYPLKRRVVVYNSPGEFRELDESDVLDGENVLPGFRLKLRTLFDRIQR